jgi:hypothetical protein
MFWVSTILEYVSWKIQKNPFLYHKLESSQIGVYRHYFRQYQLSSAPHLKCGFPPSDNEAEKRLYDSYW